MLKAGQEAIWDFHPEDMICNNEQKACAAFSAMLAAAPPSTDGQDQPATAQRAKPR